MCVKNNKKSICRKERKGEKGGREYSPDEVRKSIFRGFGGGREGRREGRGGEKKVRLKLSWVSSLLFLIFFFFLYIY